MAGGGRVAGIIGGTGRMGRLFAGVFERAGWQVLVSGRKTDLTGRDLARQADLVMVSVPIRSTVRVIREIAPVLSEGQVLCDLTSLKVAPVEAMLASRAHVLGLHPMFGPTVRSLRNQVILASPARIVPGEAAGILDIFRREGAVIREIDPADHDRLMAVVQGLTHFGTLCMADAMRRAGTDIPLALACSSPVYRIQMGLIGRLLGQDAALYGDMLQLNPEVPPVLSAFAAAVRDLQERVAGGDPAAFGAFFSRAAGTYREYIPAASAETDDLIEHMVSR